MASRWLAEEDETLRNNYASCDIDTLRQLLPDRSTAGIHARAHLLRLKKPVPEPKPAPEPKARPKHRALPDPRKRKLTRFSGMELQTLREMGGILDMPELKMLLPRKSIAQILDAADEYRITLKNRARWQRHVDKMNDIQTTWED